MRYIGQATVGRRASALKWLIFGVLLPLLPIVGRVSAHWLDDGPAPLGFIQLFGDGELLVLATVIAAAGIGDLVFSIGSDRKPNLRDGIAISFALVVVTLSALMFGLVTLESETGGTAQKNALADAATQTARANQALQQVQDQQRSLAVLRAQLSLANGQLARAQRQHPLPTDEIIYLQGEIARLSASIDAAVALEVNLSSESTMLSNDALAANHLATSTQYSSRQGAFASIVLYFVGIASGMLSLYASGKHDHDALPAPEPSNHGSPEVSEITGNEAEVSLPAQPDGRDSGTRDDRQGEPAIT